MDKKAVLEEQYRALQLILEGNPQAPATQAILQSIEEVLGMWDLNNATSLLIQCGKGIFLHRIQSYLDHFCIVEPNIQTLTALQQEYDHINSLGGTLDAINAENKMFEYTIMLYPALYMNDIYNVLKEIIRVTSKEVFFIFFNKFSIEYVFHRVYNKKEYMHYSWYSPLQLIKQIRTVSRNVLINATSLGILPFRLRSTKKITFPLIPYIGTLGIINIQMNHVEKVCTPLLQPFYNKNRKLAWDTFQSVHRKKDIA